MDEADSGADLEHAVAGPDDLRDLAGFLGLEAAAEDRPADRGGDDGRVEGNHHSGRLQKRLWRVFNGQWLDHGLKMAEIRSSVHAFG